jgi:hypothetical protein
MGGLGKRKCELDTIRDKAGYAKKRARRLIRVLVFSRVTIP